VNERPGARGLNRFSSAATRSASMLVRRSLLLRRGEVLIASARGTGYWITSWAVANSVSGTLRPRILAVLRLSRGIVAQQDAAMPSVGGSDREAAAGVVRPAARRLEKGSQRRVRSA
jgi:hypothetical protein